MRRNSSSSRRKSSSSRRRRSSSSRRKSKRKKERGRERRTRSRFFSSTSYHLPWLHWHFGICGLCNSSLAIGLESTDNETSKTGEGDMTSMDLIPARLYDAMLNYTWLHPSLICPCSGVKFQYQLCAPPWFLSLLRERGAMHHSSHSDGALVQGWRKVFTPTSHW